jgi:hypothetical protein
VFLPITSYTEVHAEQASFCEAGSLPEDVIQPVALPQPVVDSVMKSREAKQAIAGATQRNVRLDPAKLLRGTHVRLSATPTHFYIVEGQGELSGGDNAWFWIVRESGQTASVVLFTGANCLRIAKTTSFGYRDIIADWSSAAESTSNTYSSDGTLYKLRRSRRRPTT